MSDGAAARGTSRPEPEQPAWRQGYDAVERELAPRLDQLVNSEGFAVAVGLAAHAQKVFMEQAARNTRRMWHLANLPAGTDVTRLLNEIGDLQRQVGELTAQLETERWDRRRRARRADDGDTEPADEGEARGDGLA